MALDKLVDSSALDNDLTLVANAIRAKTGGTAALAFPAEFVSEIGNIGGGGASPWKLVHSEEVTANTSSTTATSLKSITISGIYTKAKIIYVRIRDKAGKRPGYFLGSDCFFINYQHANSSGSALTYAGRLIHRYTSSSQYGMYSGATTTGYGVYAYDINSSGRLRIYTRYNSNYSLTINGTYTVEVYTLDYPDGKSVFDI